MTYEEKETKIIDSMNLMVGIFNPSKSPKKNREIQFNYKEPEGTYHYYLSIREKTCNLIKGQANKPWYTIHTDYETWRKVKGEYISGNQAMKSGKLKVEGNVLAFILRFKKIFSGSTVWKVPSNLYITSNISEIKNVLVLSCSNRGKKGATQLLTEHFIKGMEKAGANVETMFPASMKITPCKGCFHCWAHNKRECIYHEKDDMKIFLEKYEKCDLLVWVTPIYVYHCSSSMKNIMDRLFITIDSHILLNSEKKEMHPRKYSRSPYQAILAVAGFTDMDVFKPLQATMKTWEKHAAFELLGELYRPAAMSFLLEDIINIKKDNVLASLEQAGTEIIQHKKISKRTKKAVEQKILPKPIYIAGGNTLMDECVAGKKWVFEREG
jgi:multimeric flavodoxin WrbA/putative sterol carrier protein